MIFVNYFEFNRKNRIYFFFYRKAICGMHLITKSTNLHVYCRLFYIYITLSCNWVIDNLQIDGISISAAKTSKMQKQIVK